MVKKVGCIGCLGVVGVVLLLVVIVAVAGPRTSSRTTETASSPSSPASQVEESASSAEEEVAAVPPSDPVVQPIALRGSGQTATDPITLPGRNAIATFKHDGRRNFAVKVFAPGAREDLLINKIGPYDGSRLISGAAPVTLDIQADGNWTVEVDPIRPTSSPAFSGRGDAVSGSFRPPGNGAWTMTHDGTRNFAVKLHCSTGSPQLIQNIIGPLDGSRVVTFRGNSCFWEVEADGSWSLAPR